MAQCHIYIYLKTKRQNTVQTPHTHDEIACSLFGTWITRMQAMCDAALPRSW